MDIVHLGLAVVGVSFGIFLYLFADFRVPPKLCDDSHRVPPVGFDDFLAEGLGTNLSPGLVVLAVEAQEALSLAHVDRELEASRDLPVFDGP